MGGHLGSWGKLSSLRRGGGAFWELGEAGAGGSSVV